MVQGRMSPLRPSDPAVVGILDELTRDLPPVLARGVRAAARRYGLRLSGDARVDACCFSRDLNPGPGGTATTSLDVDLPAVVVGYSARFYSDAAADDSTMGGIKLTQTNGAGFLLGDSQGSLNLALSAELDSWVPLQLAWLLVPREVLTLTADLDADAAGSVTITVGFMGAYLRGFGIGVGST